MERARRSGPAASPHNFRQRHPPMSTLGKRVALAAAALGLWSGGAAQGQQPTGTVIGRVTDAVTSRPVPSAQVFIPGTLRGSLTNAEGRYSIVQVPTGQHVVRVTILGYAEVVRTVTVPAGAAASADFALNPSAVELNAVVVNAVTGEAERKGRVGATVANLQVATLDQGSITKFADVVAGRAAGVDLKSTSGATGAAQKIRIRGGNSLSLSNEPLIFVDGVMLNNPQGAGTFASASPLAVGGQDLSRLNDLNPDDIANIEVLKGPAASAMYGTEAANGVLLITTKRGRVGAPTWTAYAETGSLEDITSYPRAYLSYSVLKPGSAMTTPSGDFDFSARRPCFNFQAASGACTQDSTVSFVALRDARTTPFTTGYRQQYGASVSGGTDQAAYYVSGDLQDERGVIAINTNRSLNLRANLDVRPRSNLDVHFSSGYTSGVLSRSNNDNSVAGPISNGTMGSAFYYPLVNGEVNRNNYYSFSPQDLSVYPSYQDVNHLILGGVGSYRPLSWLRANLNLGVDLANTHDYETLQPNSPLSPVDPTTWGIGLRQSNHSNSFLYTGNGSLTGAFELRPELTSETTAGASYTKSHLASTYGIGYGILPGTQSLNTASSNYSVAEGFSEVITIGAFVQEKLSWRERVFLNGSVRTDDNSAFGRRYGRIYYPAASVSWRISDEGFFPKYSWLSDLRLRAAYGTSGMRPGFRQAITYYGGVSATINGENLPSITLQATGDEFLKPERTTEYEFGGDLGVLNERLSAEFTYFHKRSTDAIIAKPLAPSLGLTGAVSGSMYTNLGSIQNRGTELSLNALALNAQKVRLSVRLAATTLNNKVLDLGRNITPINVGRSQRHQAGFPAGAYWQIPYGINDANNNGKLTSSEVTTTADTAVYLGPVLPTFSRSITGDLTLFGLVTVRTLFDWRGGNKTFNYTEYYRCLLGTVYGERGCAGVMDAHASLAEQARYLAARYRGSYAGFIEDAGFVKWRELSLMVAVPERLVRRAGMAKAASITFSGRNLRTWAKYSGVDPEVNETGSGANWGQDEFFTQPPVRYFTVRLNLTF